MFHLFCWVCEIAILESCTILGCDLQSFQIALGSGENSDLRGPMFDSSTVKLGLEDAMKVAIDPRKGRRPGL